MKIAVYSTQPYDKAYLQQHNTGHELLFYEAPLTIGTCSLAAGCTAICVFVNDGVHAAILAKLSSMGVKLIVLRCAGFNNVDAVAAKQLNIKIVRVPAYAPQAVAEHAVALILTLNRKTHKAYNRVREGNFSLTNLAGFNLHNKTAGVVGTGKIGSAFCKIMLGFGCKVLAYDVLEDDALKQAGVQYTTLNNLLLQSTIISLHCPLNAATAHIINNDTLALMQPGTMLINTSRGALINTAHAIAALKTGRLGYLGIDVYEQEEALFFNDLTGTVVSDDIIERLMSFTNVLITPHQGFFTAEALTEIAVTTFANIDGFDKGAPLINEVVAV